VKIRDKWGKSLVQMHAKKQRFGQKASTPELREGKSTSSRRARTFLTARVVKEI